MSRLADALKSVGSQIQLASPLGRFLQKVVEALVESGAAGLVGAQYLQVGASANTLVTLNTDIVLDTILSQQGIPYDPLTGIATLTAGLTYSLRAAGSMANFVGGAPPFFDATWVDAQSNAPLEPLLGTWIPVTDVNVEAPSNAVEVIYKPAATQQVKLRVLSGGGGTASAVQGHFWGVIQQIA